MTRLRTYSTTGLLLESHCQERRRLNGGRDQNQDETPLVIRAAEFRILYSRGNLAGIGSATNEQHFLLVIGSCLLFLLWHYPMGTP
jgi:hypothetical protein